MIDVEFTFLSKMTFFDCKLNFMKAPSWFMNLPTNVIKVFYQFHEPFKLVHDSSKPIGHVAHLDFHDSGPLPLATS